MPLDLKWPLPTVNNVPKWWRVCSRVVVATVGVYSKVWGEWFNTVTVHNRERLLQAVERRPVGTPLITVSNHHSCMDDPIIWSALRWQHMLQLGGVQLRWNPAAAELCFTSNVLSLFFALGQTIPIRRGDGVYQKSMDFLIDKLNNGQWVHIFPEGKVNLTHEFMRLKWGVGRLIAESKVLPIVLPIWHLGMDTVLPNRTPYIPRIGKKVTILVGQPIDFMEQLQLLVEAKYSPTEIRKQITDRIQQEFKALKKTAESLHLTTYN